MLAGISLFQPWASLVAWGPKKVETRSWHPSRELPLTVAIHASRAMPSCWELFNHPKDCAHYRESLKEIGCPVEFVRGMDRWRVDSAKLPRGAVLAVATLCRCVRTNWLVKGTAASSFPGVGELTDRERAFGDYSPGRYAWMLGDVRRLPEPVPCRGNRMLWEVPEDVVAKIEAQLSTEAR